MARSRRFALPLALAMGIGLLFATAGTAAASTTVFVTKLTGEVERPVPGDPDGSGVAVVQLDPATGEVCWVFKVRDVEPIFAAHIHIAPAGSPGPVVIPLAPPDAPSGVSMGCTTASQALVSAIVNDPSGYYVNVHNAPYPGGALRGQLG